MNNLLDGVLDGFQDEPDSDDEIQRADDDLESGKKKKGKKSKELVETPTINYMEHFFREMDNIKTEVSALGEATKAIKEIHEQALSATTNDEEDSLSFYERFTKEAELKFA